MGIDWSTGILPKVIIRALPVGLTPDATSISCRSIPVRRMEHGISELVSSILSSLFCHHPSSTPPLNLPDAEVLTEERNLNQ